MKLFSAQTFSAQKGFTLIELLVVIGILGILAASLVATIDPFEQLKKANDTKVQNGTVEFQTANVRYYAAQNAFPWEAASSASVNCKAVAGSSDEIASATLLSTTGLKACLQDLIDAGELKSGFLDVTGVLEKIYVWSEKATNTLKVCYLPTSKGGLRDKAAKYLPDDTTTPTTFTASTDTTSAGCIANGGDVACYWCTQ